MNGAFEDPLQPFFDRQGVVVLDGGLATELERRGARLDGPLWSAKVLAEAPELIEQVHYDYFAAGADVATTATYQASFEGFAAQGIGRRRAAELMRSAVGLARQARDRFWEDADRRRGRNRPLVAGSAGSYGAYLADGSEFTGNFDLSVAELVDFHRPRVELLADSGVDLIAFETIPCAGEAEAIVRLLDQIEAPPAWISFSCNSPEGVCHGERFADCVALAQDSDRVLAVGINCSPPRLIDDLLRAARSRTTKHLLCYPNSGEKWDAVARGWRPGEDAIDWPGESVRWYESGARLIGGCCRTTPERIAEIAAVMRGL